MPKQVKIENTSPDVGTINVVGDGTVLHSLAAGEHVTLNIDEVANLSLELADDETEESTGEEKVAGTLSQASGELVGGESVIVDRKDIEATSTTTGESVKVDTEDQDRKADYLAGNSPR